MNEFRYRIESEDLQCDSMTYYYKSKVLNSKNSEDLNIMIFGDILYHRKGDVLIAKMQEKDVDVVFILGDLAYDLHDDWGHKGDNFFTVLSLITSKVPTIIIAGNHDMYDYGNFLNFRYRFPGCKTSEDNNFFHFFL